MRTSALTVHHCLMRSVSQVLHFESPNPLFVQVSHVVLDPPPVRRKRSTYEPLRIKVHYDQSVKNLPDEKFRIINVSF